MEKECRICKKSYPNTIGFWHKNKSYKDGLQTACKGCMSLAAKVHSQSDRGKELQVKAASKNRIKNAEAKELRLSKKQDACKVIDLWERGRLERYYYLEDYKGLKLGSKYPTLNHGALEVIGRIYSVGWTGTPRLVKDRYLVKFTDGTVVSVSRVSIKSQSICNYNESLHETGRYVGYGEYTPTTHMKLYNTYSGIHERGDVIGRWLNFQNFCEDVVAFDLYEEWLESDDLKFSIRNRGEEYNSVNCFIASKDYESCWSMGIRRY